MRPSLIPPIFAILLIHAAADVAPFTDVPPYPDRRAAERTVDSALSRNNFYVGGGISPSIQLGGLNGDSSTANEVSLAGSLWLGYRRHFLKYLGVQGGTIAEMGPIWVHRHDSALPASDHSRDHDGFSPMGLHILTHAQLVLGPFGPIAFEPGVAYGLGWRWKDSVPLHGPDRQTYVFGNPYTSLGWILGASWYWGRYDQYAITGYYTLRGRQDAEAVVLGLGLCFKYAFRD